MSAPRHGHEPIAMRQVDTASEISRRGDYAFSERSDGTKLIAIGIPDPGERGWVRIMIPISASQRTASTWWWDGREDEPTLNPSILTHGSWHGWVTKGEMREA